MPQPEEPRPVGRTIEPTPAASSAAGLHDSEARFAELAAARGRLRDASARVASAAEALEQGGEGGERSVELFGGAVAAGGDRLDSGWKHVEDVLGRWMETLEVARAALDRCENERQDAEAGFESEATEVRNDLDERLSELAGSLGALADTAADLAPGAEALAGGLDESVSRVDQAVAAIDDAAGAVHQEIASRSDRVTGILGGELGPILAESVKGLVTAFETHLAPSENPLAVVEKDATALLMAATQTLSGVASEAIDEAPRVLEEVAPAWDTPRSLATAALDQAVDGDGPRLLEELERLREALRTGVAVTAAWTPVLAQLPALPDTAERVRELDLLDPS